MIELIVLDVDGTMTDGKLIYGNGGEHKAFDVKDGLGIATWMKLGGKVAIITGRSSQATRERARDLGIVHYFEGVGKKQRQLALLLDELKLAPSQVAAIGDDLNDLGMLQSVGMSFAPSDAVDEIKAAVDHRLQSRGGNGAVREMIELVVAHNGWQKRFKEAWL